MNKKIISFLAIFVVAISLASVTAVETTNQDFNGLFKMNVLSAENFIDPVAEEGLHSPAFGANVEFDGENLTIYYYNESNMVSDFHAENMTDYVPQILKSNSVFIDEPATDGDLYIWNNTLGGSSNFQFLVGIPSDDASEMVCIEGDNLDDLKTYANSVEFN